MKNWRTEIKWGLLFVLAGLAWTWLEKLAGLHSTRIDQHASLTMLFMIPAFALYWLAFREKKRQLGGQISFRQAFLSGLAPVVGIITSLLVGWLVSRGKSGQA